MCRYSLLVAVLVAGCGSEKFVGTTVDDAASPADGGVVQEAAPSGDAGPDRDAPSSGGCVRASSFCIDATEVTREAYAAFLVEAERKRPAQHPSCANNLTFAPSLSWQPAPGEGRYPMVNVDWCDAHTYCKWVGKRLCGRIGGGPVATGDTSDPNKSQWFAACSKGGTRAYPYGDVYDPSACNGGSEENRVEEVKSYPGCVGGYDGLFDMSGNTWEWEDACSSADYYATCTVRGGDYRESPELLKCGTAVGQARNDDSYSRISFRCCSD
jgi:formylglycine-generating enzyme